MLQRLCSFADRWMNECTWSTDEIIRPEKVRSTRRKPCPIAFFSATNPTYTGLGLNPGLPYVCKCFFEKGPAADATDAPQPWWGLLCNPVMKMISVFSFFGVMEHGWNEIDMEKPKCSGKNLSQCHFAHHKSYTDWPGIEPRPPRREAGDQPPEPWHGHASS
jgi:hypothetical protein